MNSLSVFFPMYNEREHITDVLTHTKEIMPSLGIPDYEVLFINDGSRDGCDQIVLDWAQRNGHIRLVNHPHNMGYGAALRTGFLSAEKDAVFYTDSDLPIKLTDLHRALPLLADHDLIIGYRIKRYETTRRAVYSRSYNLLMRLMFGVRVRDVNFSFKLVRREVFDRIQLTATSVFIDGQLLAEAVRYGYTIAEIPIEYTPRKFGRSNFDSLAAAWATFSEMVAYWVKR